MTLNPQQASLKSDPAPINEMLRGLDLSLSELSVPVPDDVIDGINAVLEHLGTRMLEFEPPVASGAGEMVVVIRPSDAFRQLVATVGAGEFDVARGHIRDLLAEEGPDSDSPGASPVNGNDGGGDA